IWAASYFWLWAMLVASVWRFILRRFSSSESGKAAAGIDKRKHRRNRATQQPLLWRSRHLYCAISWGCAAGLPHYIVVLLPPHTFQLNDCFVGLDPHPSGSENGRRQCDFKRSMKPAGYW